ncbi:hypothetical protein WJX82_003722 [Trebouxia sp. C0006]
MSNGSVDDSAHGGKLGPQGGEKAVMSDMYVHGNDVEGKPLQEDVITREAASKSVHVLGQDSPWEVGFNLIAGLDNAFILGYSFLIMSFLGWAAGSVLFIVGMCICFYCNCVTGTLHTLGGQRNIHFRDLARVGFGPRWYWAVWIDQWLSLFCSDVGLFILAGESIKGTHDLYRTDAMTLPYWIITFGATYFVFAMCVPHLHGLRWWSSISSILVIVFMAIIFGVSIHDGRTTPARDFGIHDTTATGTFNAMGAIGSIAFAFNTVILPELQATVRPPVVRNFNYIVLPFTYIVGCFPWIILSFVGYWAYGNDVGANLTDSLSGPPWAKALAYMAAFFQILVSLHFYACCIFESLESIWSRKNEGPNSLFNFMVRFLVRGSYVVLSTFVACLLPFFGDFISLTGSLCMMPLDLVLVLALFVKFKGHTMSAPFKIFNIALASLMAVTSIASSIAAVRYIVVDAINYHVFANV